MHVTIEINGRQALPVRTIPLLTDWRGLSPDQLAQILAGDSDHWPSFDGLTAYRLHPDGSTEPISPRWWASWVVGKLEATSNTIKAKQTSRATGRQQWRGDSLAQLPAGVFVWLDEFEAAHASQYGPVGWLARSNPEGFDPSAHALDFNPQPDPDIAPPRLVLEGFEQLIAPSTSRNFAQLCFVRALNSADKNDAHWLGLENLSSHEAAALLCGHDTEAVISVVSQLERQRGQKVRLIVGDTLARLSAGANENAGQDMGLVVRRFDRIRSACNAHFLLIHHSGKAAANGARGWSGIRAAVDTEIEVTDSPTGRCAEITKQRDLSTKGERIGFRLDTVTLGTTKWGAAATSCVVVPADAPDKPQGKRVSEVGGAVLE